MENSPVRIEFEAMILDADNGSDAAFIKIPVNVKEVFGSGRPKVKALFNESVEYRGSLVRMGTPFHMLIMRKDVRGKLAKSTGEMVSVSICLDTEERVVELPDELRKALTLSPKLKTFFDKLSYTNRKEYANFIAEAKRPETRLNRLNKVIDFLSQGRKKLR